MTIKPVKKDSSDVEGTPPHRSKITTPKSPVSQHVIDQRNQSRSSFEENRHRRNNQKSSGSGTQKPPKLRYANTNINSASCSSSSSLGSHNVGNNGENEIAGTVNDFLAISGSSQNASSISGISQLHPSSSKTILSSCNVGSNINVNEMINTTIIANNVSNLPAVLNNNNKSNISHVSNISNSKTEPIAEDEQNIYSGYNSGDEHIGQKDELSTDEWEARDARFKNLMYERGFVVEEIIEDGACLFRSISLQIYGDQDMHEDIRQQTMDYIFQNREYFAQFVTEDITNYISRKRNNHVHGNHIEIQAMSEIYNRPVELYSYKTEPINIFSSDQSKNGMEPLRLSYQRGSHYNAIINPYKATVGIGLGLAGYRITEEAPNVKQMRDAVRLSEDLEIEQTMFEDKLKTTDWEATNEAIEEQIARESYIQWCRDKHHSQDHQEHQQHQQMLSPSHQTQKLYNIKCNSTITSTTKDSNMAGVSSSHKQHHRSSPNRSSGSSSGQFESMDLQTHNFPNSDDSFLDQNDSLSDGSSSSKYYSYKSLPHYQQQRKRRSHRRKNTASNVSNVSNSSGEGHEDVGNQSNTQTNNIPCKKRKEVAGTSNNAMQESAAPSESQPFSEFYHSLLASTYSDSLNGTGQPSDDEILQKALELSRMDFMQSIMQRAGSTSP